MLLFQRAAARASSAPTALTLVAAGVGRVLGGSPGRPRAAGRSHAAGSAGALSAHRLFETPASPVISAPPDGWCCATSTRHPFRAAASVFGIGFAVAILMIGFVFADAIERLIETQFWVAERQDVTINFVEPRSDAARHALARLPGVIAVEPQRIVAVRVRVRPP